MAPLPGFFKVNVDGASSLDGHRTSGGCDIRDDGGRVVAALSKALPFHYPPDWTELLAMRRGVLLAQEMTLSKVIQAITQDLYGSQISHLI